MKVRNQLCVSLLALLAVTAVSSGGAAAADVMNTGCTLQGAMTGGGQYGWQSYDPEGSEDYSDNEWSSLFAESAGLVTCDAWNYQADFAFYDHATDLGNKDTDTDFDGKSLDVAVTSYHFGGAAFWRDPQFAAFGVSGSYISREAEWTVLNFENAYYRAGLFGDFYANDQLTFGGSVNYFHGNNELFGKDIADHDGFEFTASAKYYAMPDLALTLRGDYMLSSMERDGGAEDVNGYAVTAEAEYLVWDGGVSLVSGARFASREVFDGLQIDDTQIYAGLKFSLGGGGATTLVDRDRSGAYDNTSVMLEKLPSLWGSVIAAESGFVGP